MRLAALLYATTPKAMDKVLEALAGAVATALTRAEKTEVLAITRRGSYAWRPRGGTTERLWRSSSRLRKP